MIGLTRRQLLRRGSLLSVAAAPLIQCCGERAPLCADPAQLSRGEEQMRKTREYVETSPHAQKTCANCEFFHSREGSACGQCEILDGPVNEGGHCTSWAA